MKGEIFLLVVDNFTVKTRFKIKMSENNIVS